MGSLELECLTVRGAPRDLGRGQGEAFRERIRAFVAMRIDAADKYMAERGKRDGLEALQKAGRQSALVHREWDSVGYDEHLGIAEGADVDPLELFTVTNMTDMRDVVLLGASSGPPLTKTSPEGCTSVLVPGARTRDGHTLAGQTWDLNPEDLEYVVAVERRPVEGPSTWAIVCTGCLTIMGMNDAGVAVGTTNIKTYGAEPGVGYLGILHRAIRETTADGASKVVRTAPHAGAHTYWMADRERLVEWEASPTSQFMRDASEAPIVRSNHCLASVHVAIEGEVPSASSHRRFERASALVNAGPMDLDALKALFSDRSDGVDSISRYPEDNQGTATNAVLIAEPAARRAWACRGPAERGAWVELRFDAR
ncbi:MAG: C45 family peptidase [Polyangiales bacterium]|nr:hypothetical protein [Myxococcales bacterium]